MWCCGGGGCGVRGYVKNADSLSPCSRFDSGDLGGD